MTTETKVSFTPGPWTWFVHDDNGGTSQTMSRPQQMKFLKGANGQGFAHTVGLSEPEDTANAGLICKAPELIQVLKEIVEDASAHDYDENRIVSSELIDKALFILGEAGVEL